MSSCPLLSWCSCSAAGLCPVCKVLVVLGLVAISGAAGYFIGKFSGKKKDQK